MNETWRVYSKWHQHNEGNPIRAHSSFLNTGQKEQSKQHWESPDLLRLDTRLCRCQMPSDEEALAPGPSQKGRNQSIWRSYYVLGTARCLMSLYLFDCMRPLWGTHCLTRWFGTLRSRDSETEWRGQGLRAGMWLSREGTQRQPVCFLVYLTVVSSSAWTGRRAPHAAPPDSSTDCHRCRGFVRSSKSGAATTSQGNDTVWTKPTFLRKIFFNVQCSLIRNQPTHNFTHKHNSNKMFLCFSIFMEN